jgi:hypothetical protein
VVFEGRCRAKCAFGADGILRRFSGFTENDDSVRVCAVFVVFDAPAAGGFGEGVGVDQDFHGIEPGGFAAGEDMLFEEDFPAADFSDFHGGVATNTEDAPDFQHRGGECGFPFLDRTGAAGNGFGVDAGEPTAEPVVAPVVHDIQERWGCYDEGDGVFFERALRFRPPCPQAVVRGESWIVPRGVA